MSDMDVMNIALAALMKAEHPYASCAKWVLSGPAPTKPDGRIGSSPAYIPMRSNKCTCGIDDAIDLLKQRTA